MMRLVNRGLLACILLLAGCASYAFPSSRPDGFKLTYSRTAVAGSELAERLHLLGERGASRGNERKDSLVIDGGKLELTRVFKEARTHATVDLSAAELDQVYGLLRTHKFSELLSRGVQYPKPGERFEVHWPGARAVYKVPISASHEVATVSLAQWGKITTGFRAFVDKKLAGSLESVTVKLDPSLVGKKLQIYYDLEQVHSAEVSRPEGEAQPADLELKCLPGTVKLFFEIVDAKPQVAVRLVETGSASPLTLRLDQGKLVVSEDEAGR